MTIKQFIEKEGLEGALLIGYYGGGNYGDELLLEVLLNLAGKRHTKELTIAYQEPENYSQFHHDFGAKLVDNSDKPALLKTMLRQKKIIIGGGGLWGLDMNTNVFLLSLTLFFCRWILRKQVFLIGVGYYKSTTRFGHIAAWLAGKSARHIIARDDETYAQFKRITPHVSKDKDIAWQLKRLPLDEYKDDVDALAGELPIKRPTLFITLRRFGARHINDYTNVIGSFLKDNRSERIILALLEPAEVDPEHALLLQQWSRKYSNVTIADYSYNPIALYLYFKRFRSSLTVVSPQFHALLTAHLAGVPFMPLVYDNKSRELLKILGVSDQYEISEVSPDAVQSFVNIVRMEPS